MFEETRLTPSAIYSNTSSTIFADSPVAMAFEFQLIVPKAAGKMLLFFPSNALAKSVMIAQWDSSLSVLPVARVQFLVTAEYLKGFFPG